MIFLKMSESKRANSLYAFTARYNAYLFVLSSVFNSSSKGFLEKG